MRTVLMCALVIAGCGTGRPERPTEEPPSEAALLRRAETAWRQRVAARGGGADPGPARPVGAPAHGVSPRWAGPGGGDAADGIDRLLEARLEAARCRLVIDRDTDVLRLDGEPVFFPSAGLIAAQAAGSWPPGLVHQMPSGDGLFVGLAVDDARDTLWSVPCAGPPVARRALVLDGADFSRAALAPGGGALIVARGGMGEIAHIGAGGTEVVPLKLTGPACGDSGAAFEPAVWTEDGVVGRCGEKQRVLVATPKGWSSAPFIEVTALVRDGKALWMGVRGDRRGVVWRSLDEGETWQEVALDPAAGTPSAEEVVVTPRFVAVRTTWLAGPARGGEVYVSTNRRTFARARTPAPRQDEAAGPVERLWLDPGGWLMAASRVPTGPEGALAWMATASKDLGRSWQAVDGLPPEPKVRLALTSGDELVPGPRGLWRRRPSGVRVLVFPAP